MAADVQNGIPAGQLTRAVWRRSSHSGKEGNCVELTHLSGDTTAVRDSKAPHGPTLVCPAAGMAALVLAARGGDLDGDRA
jgi:hypothetical protein